MRRLVIALVVPLACAAGAASAMAEPAQPKPTIIWPAPGTP
ncbi:hypothetical protein ACK8HX_11330 [Oryzobacter sp. R7]